MKNRLFAGYKGGVLLGWSSEIGNGMASGLRTGFCGVGWLLAAVLSVFWIFTKKSCHAISTISRFLLD